MKVICSYCQSEIGEKEPLDNNSVSHGMCKDCYEYHSKQIAGISFNENFDRLRDPVFISIVQKKRQNRIRGSAHKSSNLVVD
jgi:hypothetical protein